jgi:dipeptidyl aminopeptidase/acylaminoacyl peptidase
MADDELENKRAFRFDDLFYLKRSANPVFSPDGIQAAFVVSIPQPSENRIVEQITLINRNTSERRILTEGASPQWSPDGRYIAFEFEEYCNAGIWIYDVLKDSKHFLVQLYQSDYFTDHYATNNFCWSPDGKTIAYVSTAPFEQENENSATRVFNHLLYKTKGGRGRPKYADDRLTQIWIVSIENKSKKLLSENEYNEHSISFSPDGKVICFISNHSGQPDLNQWSRLHTLQIVTGEVRALSPEKASAFQPVWSPDGKLIAYLGIKSPVSTNDSPAEDTQLYVVPATGGKARCLTTPLDRRVEQVSWDPSSTFIWFTAGDAGSIFLYKVFVDTGKITTVIQNQGKVLEFDISADGKDIIYSHMDSINLPDLFKLNLPDNSTTRLTSFTEELSGTCRLSPAETFWFKSFDDLKVQGWVIKPSDFIPGRTYPVILVIHGGPHNMVGYEFEDRMQLLAADGYGVLYFNPRGSSGYGQAFSYGTIKAWGEGDYEDLISGVDAAIENNDWIDPERLGVTGQSYGGYMTNRIITKTTRFKAAVADGSISNLISFAGTSLYHSLMESEFQGQVYENFEELWNCSPLKDVTKVTTPVLFLHGETDNEVPVSQADEMFVAVRKQGVDTSFVQYIAEGHGWRPDLRTASRIDLLNRMISWFDRYLK